MSDHAHWMNRCLQLARLGRSTAAPNPMVGALLVQSGRVLAEGWHERSGGPHAEVVCLNAFGERSVPEDAVLYVNLEPCDHHGRTPPCSELLITRGVRHAVVAHLDPFPAVDSKGIARLKAAGVDIMVGVEEAQARWTNRRFLTSIEQGRPYIVLKWAQSANGYLDEHPRGERGSQRISDPMTDVMVHGWRSENQAILVGSRTVTNDDPRLDVRLVHSPSPLRVVIDRAGRTPIDSNVYDGSHPTLLFTARERKGIAAEQVILSPEKAPLGPLLAELHQRSIRSVLVEGGAELLGHFISDGLWDEARILTSTVDLRPGTKAPELSDRRVRSFQSGTDRIDLFINPGSPYKPLAAWHW